MSPRKFTGIIALVGIIFFVLWSILGWLYTITPEHARTQICFFYPEMIDPVVYMGVGLVLDIIIIGSSSCIYYYHAKRMSQGKSFRRKPLLCSLLLSVLVTSCMAALMTPFLANTYYQTTYHGGETEVVVLGASDNVVYCYDTFQSIVFLVVLSTIIFLLLTCLFNVLLEKFAFKS